jgi:PmbA protein
MMCESALIPVAQDAVARAMRAGATAADAVVREGDEFSATVRLNKVERLKEAASKSLALRVFLNSRSASVFSSDFGSGSLDRLVARAIAMARATSEDAAIGLADPGQLGSYAGELSIYSEDIARMSIEQKIDCARRAEAAAFDADPRIRNSEGSSFETNLGGRVYANSLGFTGFYRSSYCALSVTPVARPAGAANGGMQRDYWYSVARSAAALDSPEAVGRKAARRTLRRLGARKVSTRAVPVVFDQETASSLVRHIFQAVRGDAIYRNASFLAGKLGERVAGESVSIIDNGVRRGGLGSRPFDDEGIPSSVTTVIEKGVLRNYLLNCYAARKLGLPTTGNASRGLAGPPSIGTKNLYLAPGTRSPREIIGSVTDGFYVTELIGFGVNVVTGDYSRGAAGLWIEKGELAWPVEEVTIGGNLREMLFHVDAIGSNLEFRGPIAAPTLLISGLTVAGA